MLKRKIKRRLIRFIIERVRLPASKSLETFRGFLRIGRFLRHHKGYSKVNGRTEVFNHLQKVHIGEQPVTYLEFGVFKGTSILHWASINKHSDSLFYGFDSFEGLPETWDASNTILTQGHFSTQGQVPVTNDSRVHFVKGVFQQTLPDFCNRHTAELNRNRLIIHCDADLYSSELYCLTRIFPFIKPGTLLLFDDFAVPNHDFQAFIDFTRSHLIDYKLLVVSLPLYNSVAFEITAIKTDYR